LGIACPIFFSHLPCSRTSHCPVKNRVIEILAQKGSKSIILDDAITHLILKYDELGYLKRKQYREIMIELYHEGKFSAENLGNKNQLTLKSKIKVV
jgi:hypothetical protein